MREDLLHFIWKYKKLQLHALYSSKQEVIEIVEVGQHNQLAGPDFFNARINIDGQLWAGNVEIHLNASDWYSHRHEEDPNYDNVILHVVWQDDTAIFRADGTEITTLELKNYISQSVLEAYRGLFDKAKSRFVNCETELAEVDVFLLNNWLERLYFERLESKNEFIVNLLEKSKGDWEQVLFTVLLKSFGLKINADSFFSLAQAIEFSTVRKLSSEVFAMESVLYGMTGLLTNEFILDAYFIELAKRYEFLKTKFKLDNAGVRKPDFFKLRPPNFPTIRLSQLANIYGSRQNLFSSLISSNSYKQLKDIFAVKASQYWDTHYTFGKETKKHAKRLTTSFIDLLIINTVLPLKFCYAQLHGQDVNDDILEIIRMLKIEDNSVVNGFVKYGVKSNDALSSQALLQLYNEYCTKNRCLQCAVGASLLAGNA